jgi:hypothetical protein
MSRQCSVEKLDSRNESRWALPPFGEVGCAASVWGESAWRLEATPLQTTVLKCALFIVGSESQRGVFIVEAQAKFDFFNRSLATPKRT